MTTIGKDFPVRAEAFCFISEKRASSAAMSPADTECFDIFSPPPGDNDVISQTERLNSKDVKIAAILVWIAVGMIVSRVGGSATPLCQSAGRYPLPHGICLAHLARDTAFALEHGSDDLPLRFKLWFGRAFDLAKEIADFADSTIASKKRVLENQLADILGAATDCDLARKLQAKIARARDQLLTFCDYPGEVGATNNGSERALRPSVIQRKVTNGYRAMWAAQAEADVRTTVDTARLKGANPFQTILEIVA
jgi:hypothetical protein